MEPRLIDAEIRALLSCWPSLTKTFNGAASHRRGDRRPVAIVHTASAPFNGAASHRRGDPSAIRSQACGYFRPSMEPRLIDAEIFETEDASRADGASFNGAASHRRGDLAADLLRMPFATIPFNGAASHRRGDPEDDTRMKVIDFAFNGAASHRRGDRRYLRLWTALGLPFNGAASHRRGDLT